MELGEMMEVEFLAQDELIVELEVRGLINPAAPQEITDSLKQALRERLPVEQAQPYKAPQNQHEAAIRQPLQEVATCQAKLRAVQLYILTSIWSLVPVDEILPRVYTKMLHVQGRMYRAVFCDIFGEMSAELYDVRTLLWDMVDQLDEGVPPDDVADQLSRAMIKIDAPESKEVEVEEEGVATEPEEVKEEQQEGDGMEDQGIPVKRHFEVPARLLVFGGLNRCAHNSKLRRKIRSRAQSKWLRNTRRIRRIHAWIGWYAVRALLHVDRLVGVLDLRLEYEVLAKANRRVSYANAYAFLLFGLCIC